MHRVKFYRAAFGGWTRKAVSTPDGNWIPRIYVLNWRGDKAPDVVLADIPQWLWDKALTEDSSVQIINPERDGQWIE